MSSADIPRPFFRITREFQQIEHVTPSAFDKLPYMLDPYRVDLAHLFHAAHQRFAECFSANVKAALNSPVWGGDHFSVKDTKHGFALFDPLLGGVKVSEQGSNFFAHSLIAQLFNQENKGRIDSKRRTFRGARFFVGMDTALSMEQKFEVIKRDIQECGVVASLPASELSDADFSGWWAAHDYYTNAIITAYHALTYGERAGANCSNDQEYMRHRSILEENAIFSYRNFLCALLGREVPVDHNLSKRIEYLSQSLDYLKTRNIDRRHVPIPELSNPLTVLCTADNAFRKYKTADLVVGLPSGGTMLGIAVQLTTELYTGQKPELLLCPNSIHSDKYLDAEGTPSGVIKGVIGQRARGFTALVCDDNANTFATQNRMDLLLREAGARDVQPVIAELDVYRAMIKQGTWVPALRPKTVANFVRLADVAGAVVPITRQRPNDRQLRRKLIMEQVFRAYYKGERCRNVSSTEGLLFSEDALHLDATVSYAEYMKWLQSEADVATRQKAGEAEEAMARRLPIRLHEYQDYKRTLQLKNVPLVITIIDIDTIDYLLYFLIPKGYGHQITIKVKGNIDQQKLSAVYQRCIHHLPGTPILFSYS